MTRREFLQASALLAIRQKVNMQTILPSDSRLYWSPANTVDRGPSKLLVCPGGYVNLRFKDSGFVNLSVDMSPQSSAGIQAGFYPRLAYGFDNGPRTERLLSAGDTTFTLATGLLLGVERQLNVTVMATGGPNVDAWNTPVQGLRITGLQVADAATVLTAQIRPKRILIFGDSNAIGNSAGNNRVFDARATHLWLLAKALDAEIGLVGYGGQGFSVGAQAGRNTPAMQNALDFYCLNEPRSLSALGPIDFVFVGNGGNDFLQGQSGSVVQAAVMDICGRLEAALPTAQIVLFVTNSTRQFPVEQGNVAASLPRTTMINAGTDFMFGTGATEFTNDGIHLFGSGHGEVAVREMALLKAAGL